MIETEQTSTLVVEPLSAAHDRNESLSLPAHGLDQLKPALFASLRFENLQASAEKLSTDIEMFLVDCTNATGNEPGTSSEILGLLFFSDPGNLSQSLLTYVRETNATLFDYLSEEQNLVKLFSFCTQIFSLGLDDQKLDSFFTNELQAISGLDREAFTALIMEMPEEKLFSLQILQRQSPSFYAALGENLEVVGARLQNLELAIGEHVDNCPDLIKLHSQISFRNARVLGSEVAIIPAFAADSDATDVSMAIFTPRIIHGYLFGHDFTELIYPRRFEDEILNYAVTLSTIKIDAKIMNLLTKVSEQTGEAIDRRIYDSISAVYRESDHDYIHHLTSLSPEELTRLANVIKDEELLGVLHHLTVDLWEASPELAFLPMEALAIRINFIAATLRDQPDSEAALARHVIVENQEQFIKDLVQVYRTLKANDDPQAAEVTNYLLYVYCSRLFQIFNIHETQIVGPTEQLETVKLNVDQETERIFEFLTKNSTLKNPGAVAASFKEKGIPLDNKKVVVQAILDLPADEWAPMFTKTLQSLKDQFHQRNAIGKLELCQTMSALEALKLHFLTSGAGYLGWVIEPNAMEPRAEILKQFGSFMSAMESVYFDLLKAS